MSGQPTGNGGKQETDECCGNAACRVAPERCNPGRLFAPHCHLIDTDHWGASGMENSNQKATGRPGCGRPGPMPAVLLCGVLLAACSGGQGDGVGAQQSAPVSGSTAAVQQSTGDLGTATAAATAAFSFTGTAGFETGLVKLITIDGRLKGGADVTVNWGDRVSSDALYANCTGLLNRTDCEIWGTHLYHQPGTYHVAVTYTLEKLLPSQEQPETVTATGHIAPLGDFVVVGIGDSYYSGEGTPLHRRSLLDRSNTALWNEPSANYFTGSLGPKIDSNGTEFITEDGINTCHRSQISGSLLTAQTIRANGNAVTFVHMACSGAKMGNGPKDEVPPVGSGAMVRDTTKFINEQLDWVRTRVPRIDALLMSAGGNNVGFADTIGACLCLNKEPGTFCEAELEGRGFCSAVDENGDSEIQDQIDADFAALPGLYAGIADDIQCRSRSLGSDFIGHLCTKVQYRAEDTLRDGETAVALVGASHSGQDGKTIVTVDGKVESAGGCHNFLLDATDVAHPMLALRKVEKPDDACGLFETGHSNSEPFGETLYVRGGFDGWSRVPDWNRRFINMGDGTLQAEFVLPAMGTGPWPFKVAGLEEPQVPGITLINHYPDVTRNAEGDTPSWDETVACTGFLIAPSEWDFLQQQLVLRLHRAIGDAATQYGWYQIDVPEFERHGYCVADDDARWMVRAGESFIWQGDKSGSAHPNAAGHRYYSRQMYAQLEAHNPPRSHAVATTASGAAYEFGTVATEDVDVSLTAENPLRQSGLERTYYSVGEPMCTAESAVAGACTEYTGPITVGSSGVHRVSFFSTNAGATPETRVWPVTVVIDKDPPEMTCSAAPGQLWPPNGRLVDVVLQVTAVDATSGPAPFSLVGVSDSEEKAAEDVVGFVVGTDDTSGQLRARRQGNGPGRTYTFTYESADAFGNRATCDTEVRVPHDQSPASTTP